MTGQLLLLYSSSSSIVSLLLLASVLSISLSINVIYLRKSYNLDFIYGLINSVRLRLTLSIILFGSNLVNLSLVGSFWNLSDLHHFGIYHEIHFKDCNSPSVVTHISYQYQQTETLLVLQSCTHTFFRMLLFNVLCDIPHSNSNHYQILCIYLSVLLPERKACIFQRGLYAQEESGIHF
jgi:hypothetical protein